MRDAVLRTAVVGVAVTSALALAPLALPLLPESAFVAYAGELHLASPESENHRAARLPQLFADMHGWRELADRVAAAERLLPPSQRAQAAILTQNYGEAAAIDVFGDGSLPVICGHNSYFLWGPHGDHPVLIIVGGNIADHRRVFRDVQRVETVHAPDAMPYEDDLPIYIARDPKVDLSRWWPPLRHDD